MPGALFGKLYAALEMTVLERLAAGVFRLLSPVPSWLHTFYPTLAEGDTGLRPGELFPFLEHFLVDAERFWQANCAGQLKSGLWREVTPLGQEYHLEAMAVNLDEVKILLLTFPRMEYEEKQALIQKARDNSLSYYRFHKELQQKDVLLHCIVHDLSSPLTSIMLSLSLLDTEVLTAGAQKAIALCLAQAHRQQALIQEILDVFAVEVGAFAGIRQVSERPADLFACFQAVVEALQPSCERHHITLQFTPEIDQAADWQVVGDTSRLERVIFNLVENAIRYSPPQATVTLGIIAQDASVLVTVDDAGPGVPASLVPTIFEKFSQAQDSTGKTGLGLYFCRIMIEGWGGNIGYTPRPTGGARFWFTLPRSVAQPAFNAPVG
jgi:signal transduction histidine kinase